jgi:hypothetical protein
MGRSGSNMRYVDREAVREAVMQSGREILARGGVRDHAPAD